MRGADALAEWLKRLHWVRGFRAAVAVGGALLASHFFGLPPAAAALGAFNPLLVDNGGPYRPRLITMLTTILGGSVSFILGALVPQHLWVVLAATLLVAFFVTFARVLAQPMASSSVLILVLYFAGLGGTQHTLSGAVYASALVLAGGLWAVLLSLFFWTVDPFRPARLSIATCYLWLARFTAGLVQSGAEEADEADPGFAWRHQQRIRIEAARTALSETGARAPSRTIRAHILTVLLATSDMLLARTMRLSELKATAARLHLEASFELAGELTGWLAGAEAEVAEALSQRPADRAAAFAREGSLRLQYVTRRKQLLAGRGVAEGDPVHRHLLVEERDGLLEVEIAFDAVRALWTGVETPASHFVSRLEEVRVPGWQDALRANWTLQSAGMRHALRLMVVGVVDVVAMRLIHVNHGFWLPMTSIILMQPFSAGTVRKSVQRVTGTILGGMLAALLAVLVSTPLAMLCIVTTLSALTVATFAVDYAVYCFFLTPTFVLLSLPHAHDWPYALIRIGTTLSGAAIAVLAMRLLWPERAEVELGHLLRRGSGAAADYLQAVLGYWAVPSSKASQAEREVLAPARRACGLASNDAEEALDRVLQEPSWRKRAAAENVLRAESLTFVTYLRRLTQSMTTLARVGRDTAENRLRLEPIVERLQGIADGFAGERNDGEMTSGFAGSEEVTLDLGEEQMQRMERQTAVLERAAKALWGAGPARGEPELETLATPEQQEREAADNERGRQPQP